MDDEDLDYTWNDGDHAPSRCRVRANNADEPLNLKARLHEVDAEIEAVDALPGLLDKLTVERVRLQNRRDTLTPRCGVGVLPDELLSRIFVFACEEPFHNLYDIIQVNRQFRAVATDTAKLWTRLHLSQSRNEHQLWLRRSKNAPLDITDWVTNDAFLSQTVPALRLIAREAHRIRKIRFDIEDGSLVRRLLAEISLNNEMPLEEAHFSCEGVAGGIFALPKIAFPFPTPRLRSFSGYNVVIAPNEFRKLTHLKLSWILSRHEFGIGYNDPFTTILMTIAHLPDLRSFTFELETVQRWGRAYVVPNHPEFCSPKLLELSVLIGAHVEMHGMAFFMAHLSTPRLQSLDFTFSTTKRRTEDIREVLDSIGSLNLQLLDNLRHLRFVNLYELANLPETVDCFTNMLSRMPNLESINLLTKHLLSDDTLWKFCTEDGFFPRLKAIHLQECEHITVDGIQRLLDGPPASWPQLSIADCPSIPSAKMDYIRNLMGDKFLGEQRQHMD